jgi:hypothetical protein
MIQATALLVSLVVLTPRIAADPSPVGKWKGEVKVETKAMEANAKTAEEKNAVKAMITAIKKNTSEAKIEITFKADGTFSSSSKTSASEKVEKGTWKAETGKLLLQTEGDKKETTTLDWTKDQKKLVLSFPKDPSGLELKIEFSKASK